MLNLIPEGVDGTITIMADRPWVSQGGIVLGHLDLNDDMPQEAGDLCVELPGAAALTGKHAIFLTFEADQPDKSLCVLNTLRFK